MRAHVLLVATTFSCLSGPWLRAQQPPPRCAGAVTTASLDHVVLVVRDLDRAAAGFEQHGFRTKSGRLHPNGLLNRHIKFRDGTSLELMTVQGRAGDAMAEDYSALLESGEGGVYVALSIEDLSVPHRAAGELRMDVVHSASGSWRFLGFPPASPAAAVFFGSAGPAVRDPDSLVTHAPDVVGLAEAWVEGGPALTTLLARLGARHCGTSRSPDGRTGERWSLARGSVVVVPSRSAARPRVIGVALQRRTPGGGVMHPHPTFWVWHRFERD